MKQVSILLALAFLAGILIIVKRVTADGNYEYILEMAREHRREEDSAQGPLVGWRRKRSVRGRWFFPVRSVTNQNRFFGRRIFNPHMQRLISERTLSDLTRTTFREGPVCP